MTIMQTYGLREIHGDVGIELEMEYAEKIPAAVGVPFTNHWKVGLDGSLRGAGCEFSTRGPRRMEELPDVFDALRPYLTDRFSPRVSTRAATHFHINCQQREMKEVIVIATAWWWCEQLMMQYFDPTRDGNLFCLGVHHANHAPVHLSKRKRMGLEPDPHNEVFITCRYAALNLASLSKFGSLEFRCMPSTRSIHALDKWARMCYNVCKVYKEYESPEAFMDAVFHGSAKDILYSIFKIGQVVDELASTPNFERLLQVNVPLLVNYAYGGHLFKGVKVGPKQDPWDEDEPDLDVDDLIEELRMEEDNWDA